MNHVTLFKTPFAEIFMATEETRDNLLRLQNAFGHVHVKVEYDHLTALFDDDCEGEALIANLRHHVLGLDEVRPCEMVLVGNALGRLDIVVGGREEHYASNIIFWIPVWLKLGLFIRLNNFANPAFFCFFNTKPFL